MKLRLAPAGPHRPRGSSRHLRETDAATARATSAVARVGPFSHAKKLRPCFKATAMSAARRRLVIDTDTGVDDAQALVSAVAWARRHPSELRIEAVLVSHGNAGLAHTQGNAVACLVASGVPPRKSGNESSGSLPHIPVYIGAATPLAHKEGSELLHAAEIHGADGLGDTGFGAAAPAADYVDRSMTAVEALLRLAAEPCGVPLDVLTLGPLTNLAQALLAAPQTLPSQLGTVYVMGGAHTGRGNTTPSAEFNVAADPEAAEVVFRLAPFVVAVTWETTLACGLGFDWMAGWLGEGRPHTPPAAFLSAVSANLMQMAAQPSLYHKFGYLVPDPLAAFVAVVGVEASGARCVGPYRLRVECTGKLTRGATIVDWDDLAPYDEEGDGSEAGGAGATPAPRRSSRLKNTVIVEGVDMGAFKAFLMAGVTE